MKLIMERWNRFSIQEESVLAEQKSEIEEGIVSKYVAPALLGLATLFSPGKAQAAEPTIPDAQTTQQTQKADLEAVDAAMIQLASSLKSVHLLLSANSIGAVKMQGGPLSKCLDALKTLSDNGISTQDYEATLIDAVKNSINPQTHYDGLDQLNDLYNQVQKASDDFQPTPNK